jgi:hypothetical protein
VANKTPDSPFRIDALGCDLSSEYGHGKASNNALACVFKRVQEFRMPQRAGWRSAARQEVMRGVCFPTAAMMGSGLGRHLSPVRSTQGRSVEQPPRSCGGQRWQT